MSAPKRIECIKDERESFYTIGLDVNEKLQRRGARHVEDAAEEGRCWFLVYTDNID